MILPAVKVCKKSSFCKGKWQSNSVLGRDRCVSRAVTASRFGMHRAAVTGCGQGVPEMQRCRSDLHADLRGPRRITGILGGARPKAFRMCCRGKTTCVSHLQHHHQRVPAWNGTTSKLHCASGDSRDTRNACNILSILLYSGI